MKAYSRLDRFEKLANSISRTFNWVSFAAVVAMLFFITIDLVGHKVFHWGLIGVTEIAGLMGLLLVSFSLAFTQSQHAHIEIDFLTNRISGRAQAVVAFIVSIFGLALFAGIVWQMLDFGQVARKAGEVTATEHIPISILAFIVAICSLLMFGQLLVAFFRLFKGGTK